MGNEIMGLEELAVYLQRDAREIHKMASRGYLPGQKVSGQWRFHTVEINNWLSSHMHSYSDQELTALETGASQGRSNDGPLVSSLIIEATIAVPLHANTRASVLQELVKLAEKSWQVYDPEAIHEAVRHREEIGSTAIPGGVALPHPHRPLPRALGEDVLAFGRTINGIHFGTSGTLTDLFFLVLCRDHRTHLKVLARLSRLLLRPGFLENLRAAETPAAVFQLIQNTENALLAE